ncbi:MAG: glutamine amidotransferase-related protein, partial [Brevibacterium aurantiacum]
MTRVLVIVNDIESQPGLLTQWMVSENIEFDLRIGGVSRLPAPSALSAYDGLIMLGGGYMPDETDRAPWLESEAQLSRHALETDLPQFGICLGGQLIAHVIGGDVRARTGAPEKGYTWIDMTEDAS